MKTKQLLARSLWLLAFATFNLQPANSYAQGAAFTYQGRLNNSGSPANGSYDLPFALFNASTGGSRVGGTVTNLALGVTNGLFITTLDFGGVFIGNAAWLAIGVRTNNPANSLTFAPLTPLQALTPTPYAVFANTASNISGMVLAAQVSGPVPSANLSGTYGNALTLNNAGNNFSGTLNGNAATATTANGFSGSLAGDVTGPQSATVVSSVGGLVATNIASGVGAFNAATSAATANTIVKRDAGGNFANNSITLNGSLNLPSTTASAGMINLGGSPFLHAYGGQNIFAGCGAGNVTMSGYANTAVGYQSLHNNTSGSVNTANGVDALNYNTSGNNNTANGGLALNANTTWSWNTANGVAALYSNATGTYNTANGDWALYYNTNGFNNTANGVSALFNETSGSQNIAMGFNAGFNITTGSYNIDIGNQGVASDNGIIRIGTSGTQVNTFIAGSIQATTNWFMNNSDIQFRSDFFHGLGWHGVGKPFAGVTVNGPVLYGGSGGALGANTGGAENGAGLAFGSGLTGEGIASKRTTGGNQNGLDFYTAFASQMSIANSGNVGIGTTSPAHKLVVQADDSGPYYDAQQLIIQGNTSNNQQLELGYKTGGNYGSIQAVQQNVGFRPLVLQPSGGNVGIGTTSPGYPLTMNSGAYCSSAGVWTSVSDRNAKESFTAINPRAVLEKVSARPITEWKYKDKVEADGNKHIGPMAQDFHAAFGLNGADDKHIATVDESGVALAAIQGLNQKLNQKLEQKEMEITELKARLDKLEQLISVKNDSQNPKKTKI
jgi:hypothetical protein